jgi:hypothetical protein
MTIRWRFLHLTLRVCKSPARAVDLQCLRRSWDGCRSNVDPPSPHPATSSTLRCRSIPRAASQVLQAFHSPKPRNLPTSSQQYTSAPQKIYCFHSLALHEFRYWHNPPFPQVHQIKFHVLLEHFSPNTNLQNRTQKKQVGPTGEQEETTRDERESERERKENWLVAQLIWVTSGRPSALKLRLPSDLHSRRTLPMTPGSVMLPHAPAPASPWSPSTTKQRKDAPSTEQRKKAARRRSDDTRLEVAETPGFAYRVHTVFVGVKGHLLCIDLFGSFQTRRTRRRKGSPLPPHLHFTLG